MTCGPISIIATAPYRRTRISHRTERIFSFILCEIAGPGGREFLMRGSAAAGLLGLRVRIPLEAGCLSVVSVVIIIIIIIITIIIY